MKPGPGEWKPTSDLLVDGSRSGYITSNVWAAMLVFFSNGNFIPVQLNEKIMSDHWGFRFETNHFMYNSFNRKVVQLFEAGIAETFVKKETPTWRNEEIEYQDVPLTFDHLGVWFNIAVVFLCFALTAFIIELMFLWVHNITVVIREWFYNKIRDYVMYV
jgi:hypothetical protein